MSLSILTTILITILVLYVMFFVCELIKIYIREMVAEEFEREKLCCKQKEKKKENVYDKKNFEELFKTFMEQQDAETTVF